MTTNKDRNAMRNFWLTFTDWISHIARQADRCPMTGERFRSRRLPGFEQFEDRVLLDCDARINIGDVHDRNDDYLIVEGDNAANIISIRLEDGDYIVNVDCNADGDYVDVDDEHDQTFLEAQVRDGILILGAGGNDRITVDATVTMNVEIEGGEGRDHLTGGSGNDQIRGGAGNDLLWGGGGNDGLHGGSANDRLDGGLGADVLDGGDGTDAADYSTRAENLRIDLDGVADDGAVGEGDDVQANIENVWGGSGNDRIVGSDVANTLRGNGGNDVLRGGSGNDYLYGGNDADTLWGENGDDRLYGQSGDDSLYGGAGRDHLFGGAGTDHLFGGNGDDWLYGQEGEDALFGQSGNDTLFGGAELDYLDGGIGRDSLFGGTGDDELEARDGEPDEVDGGAGDDVARIDKALDTLVNVP